MGTAPGQRSHLGHMCACGFHAVCSHAAGRFHLSAPLQRISRLGWHQSGLLPALLPTLGWYRPRTAHHCYVMLLDPWPGRGGPCHHGCYYASTYRAACRPLCPVSHCAQARPCQHEFGPQRSAWRGSRHTGGPAARRGGMASVQAHSTAEGGLETAHEAGGPVPPEARNAPPPSTHLPLAWVATADPYLALTEHTRMDRCYARRFERLKLRLASFVPRDHLYLSDSEDAPGTGLKDPEAGVSSVAPASKRPATYYVTWPLGLAPPPTSATCPGPPHLPGSATPPPCGLPSPLPSRRSLTMCNRRRASQPTATGGGRASQPTATGGGPARTSHSLRQRGPARARAVTAIGTVHLRRGTRWPCPWSPWSSDEAGEMDRHRAPKEGDTLAVSMESVEFG